MNKELTPLKALEKIDHTICLNINSKTLKFGLDEFDNCDCKDFDEFDECYTIVEKALKALEIIKNKKVDVDWFIDCAIRDYDFIHEKIGAYNECVKKGRYIDTREEYELLKEVLKDE